MTVVELPSKQDFEAIAQKIDRMIELLEQKKEEDLGEWLKSGDVIKVLKCGTSTLASYRAKGVLPHKRIGGVYYYRKKDVLAMLSTSTE